MLNLQEFYKRSITDLGLASASIDSGSKEDEEGYGWGGFRPPRLQFLNNEKFALICLCLANFLSNIANGLIGVTISTLERRYNFSSQTSSLIIIAHEFGAIASLFFIQVFGKETHRPLVIGIFLMVTGIGCIIFYLPQRLSPNYYPGFWDQRTYADVVKLCDYSGYSGESTCTLRMSIYFPMFFIGRFFIGFASMPILSCSLVFLNDNVMQENLEYYSLILKFFVNFGPAAGALISTIFMNLFVDFHFYDITSNRFHMDESVWIGCWSLPYLLIAGLCILLSIVMFGYEEELPTVIQVHIGSSRAMSLIKEDDKMSDKNELVKNVKSFLLNGRFILMTGFSVLEHFIHYGFAFFGPKIFENLLDLSSYSTAHIFSLVFLPAGLLGSMCGMKVLSKYKLEPASILYFEIVLSIFAIFLFPSFLLACKSVTFAGSNYAFPGNLEESVAYADCNKDCHCSKLPYQPVCSIHGVQYFSACHAGCGIRRYSIDNSLHLLFNCSCIMNVLRDDGIPSAYEYPCVNELCKRGILLMFLVMVIMMISFACYTMNAALYSRSLSEDDANLVFTLQTLFIKCLGAIPSAIIFGAFVDWSCGMWEANSCGDGSSNCVAYQINRLSRCSLIINLVVHVAACQVLVLLNARKVVSKE